MMLTTAYDTVMRYFFARPTEWSVELNEVFLVFITLFAGAELVKRDQHIQMDLLYNQLPGGPQKGVRILIYLVGFLICAGLFWLGVQATISTYIGKVYAAGAFRLPLWVLYVMIPIGMGFMFLEYLARLLSELKRKGTPGRES
jgi:TRAP-type C4-dicarboxylate transport system permease small subunit